MSGSRSFGDEHRDALREVISRACTDQAFRARLLNDPRAAIREASGVTPPDTLRIKFIERDPDVDVMIVLPDVVGADGDLAPEDLEAVAGGTDWCDNTCEAASE